MWHRAERDRFMRHMIVGAVFEITNLWVFRDGQNIDHQYHLQFNEDTEVKHVNVVFPPISFTLYSCAEVSSRTVRPSGFLGE